jgi:AAA domain
MTPDRSEESWVADVLAFQHETLAEQRAPKKPSKSNGEDKAPQPFEIPPASTWAARTPPPRAWTWEGWIPRGRVTSLMADGGVGKSLLAQTIGTACASGRGTLYGAPIASGVVLGIFTEEEQDELERRERPICESLGIDLAALDDLHLLSRFGEDNLLATYIGGIAVPTPFYWRLDATCALLRPHLVILDPAADYYGGNPVFQGEVRQFVQIILGGLCARHDCSVLLPMHPSAAGIASGDGGGFSVAWHNSVRSRLYLEHTRSDDVGASDRLTLTRKKSNYAARGEEIKLLYDRGAFVMEEPGGIVDAIRDGNTRRAVLALLAGCEAAGRRVASSPKANENAGTILGERPGYPPELRGKAGKTRLFALLRGLEEAKLIVEATVKTANRKEMGVWQLTDAGRADVRQ